MSDVPDWYSDILPELQKLPPDIFLKLPTNVSDKTIFKDHLKSVLTELNQTQNGTTNNVQTELDTPPEETVLLPSNESSLKSTTLTIPQVEMSQPSSILESEMSDVSESNHDFTKNRPEISPKRSMSSSKPLTSFVDSLHDPDVWLDSAFSLPKNVTKEMI